MSDGEVFHWPITSRMTVKTTDDLIDFPHSRAGQWPVEDPFGDGTATEASLWAICRVGEQWIAGTIDWVRPGQTHKTRPAKEYGPCWKAGYDSYAGPTRGETVGYFVSTLARMGKRSAVNERSQIVWIKYQTNQILGEEPMTPDPDEPDDPETPVPPIPVPDDLADRIAAKIVSRMLPFMADILNSLEEDVNRERPIEFKIFGKTIKGKLGRPG